MDKQTLFSRTTLFTGDHQLEKLQNATVLIAGVGGLGCVVSHILARRGVGKLLLLDCKEIDLPDLNRQMLFRSADIGKPKIEVAADYIKSIHPFTEIIKIDAKITDSKEFYDLMQNYKFDIIADCLDNFSSRYALEKLLGGNQYLVHGGVQNDFGQVTTIKQGMSLKSLYEGVFDTDGIIPVCPEIVNIIGSMMANEVVSCLTNQSKLIKKLLIFELSDYSLFKIDLK